VLCDSMADDALRGIARMKVGPPRPLRCLGEKLQQHAAGAPAMSRSVAAAPFLANGEPHPGRNLFRAKEIFMCGVLEAATFERDQALVSVHVRALIDGHREMALAEQRA